MRDIAPCPQCIKNISIKLKKCPYCNVNLFWNGSFLIKDEYYYEYKEGRVEYGKRV